MPKQQQSRMDSRCYIYTCQSSNTLSVLVSSCPQTGTRPGKNVMHPVVPQVDSMTYNLNFPNLPTYPQSNSIAGTQDWLSAHLYSLFQPQLSLLIPDAPLFRIAYDPNTNSPIIISDCGSAPTPLISSVPLS